jgi:hypothetical protein
MRKTAKNSYKSNNPIPELPRPLRPPPTPMTHPITMHHHSTILYTTSGLAGTLARALSARKWGGGQQARRLTHMGNIAGPGVRFLRVGWAGILPTGAGVVSTGPADDAHALVLGVRLVLTLPRRTAGPHRRAGTAIRLHGYKLIVNELRNHSIDKCIPRLHITPLPRPHVCLVGVG